VDPVSDRRLGRAALAVTALLIAIVAVSAAIALRHSPARGDIEIPAEWRAASDYTLIIFGRESCPACAASAPFHRELAAAAIGRDVRVIAASTSSAEDPAAFARSIGVAPDHAIRATPPPKNMKSVPALVVVKRDGAILRHTEGLLTADQRRQFISFVGAIR
jgi:hypothetical protein